MKKTYQLFILLAFLSIIIQSCEKQDDNIVPNEITINNFIWKGLNLYYLWQTNVTNLSDSRFSNQKDLNNFLYGYPSPENLFQNLLYKPVSRFPIPGEAVDRFSVVFSDYLKLEGILSGTTENNGAEFGLFYKDATQTTIFGVVRYILPNSDAASKNIQRGAIFYGVDNITLNIDNYSELLGNNSYTLNLANYDDGNITPNGLSVSLTKTILSENPVYINNVIVTGSHKIGYLMYNGFFPNYETELNNEIGELKAQGITELVLDLRYNSGGSVQTATRLASMITGQFTNQIFAKEQWNPKVQANYNVTNPSNLFNLFTNQINNNVAINHLNLTKLYVLTTKSTASASELVINGLEPYINVIQIGDKTTGKNVGSITLYDSPNFSKENSNPNHRYAMQPLVLKIVNKIGFGDYNNGLEPDIFLKEDIANLGILGNENELLLNTAITRIIGGGRIIPKSPRKSFENVIDNTAINRLKSEMYLEKIPDGFVK